MKKIDLEVFCNEIINFDANKKNYWDMMDDAILKSLKLKGKKIPKEFDYRNYEDKSVYFKKINKSLNFINLLRIEDGDNVNYLNCGILIFGHSLNIKEDTKILFVEENFGDAPGMVENPVFVPIKKIDNSTKSIFVKPSSLSNIISEEVVNYYNIHNRFGVKLPVINHETAYEMFNTSIFVEMSIYINQDHQHNIDINSMEKIFKLGFNTKVNNSPTNDYLFRNYFDKKHKMVPAGPFYIYFYKVDFKIFDKVKMYCNPKNAFKEIFFKE